MDREQKIQTLKEELHGTDYIALKATEGCDMGEYGDWKKQRQDLRDEINHLMEITDEEYFKEYPEELPQELKEEQP